MICRKRNVSGAEHGCMILKKNVAIPIANHIKQHGGNGNAVGAVYGMTITETVAQVVLLNAREMK